MNAPLFRLQGVTRRYGSRQVLAIDHLEIRQNEILALVGPSGAGKSTLLRLLNFLELPTQGTICFRGVEIGPDRQPSLDLRRRVTTVFQRPVLLRRTVYKNVRYGLQLRGWRDREERIGEVLEQVGLTDLAQAQARTLSGGEAQRVALARALIKRPKVLLLDEPLGALDKKLREQMQIELRVLQKSVGITFVFVTHDQEEALTLSDRIAVMSKGVALQIDSPTRLYEAPTNRFVADFIGTMNFFSGAVRAVENGDATIDAGPLGDVATPADALPAGNGSDIVVALRPEKIRLAFEAPGDATNVVEGRMGPTAYLGDRSHFYVFVPGREEPIAVAHQNLEKVDIRSHDTDRPVWLSWSRDAVVLLPSD